MNAAGTNSMHKSGTKSVQRKIIHSLFVSLRIAPDVSDPFPKRQGAGALQDASRGPGTCGSRASVLECGGPPPLSVRDYSMARFGWFIQNCLFHSIGELRSEFCSAPRGNMRSKMKLPYPLENVDISVQPIREECLEGNRTFPVPGSLSSGLGIRFAIGFQGSAAV
jgi:hypothetical protein